MKTNLTLLALAFLCLFIGAHIAAVGLCIVIAVLLLGDALDSLPGCDGVCNQGRAPCSCRPEKTWLQRNFPTYQWYYREEGNTMHRTCYICDCHETQDAEDWGAQWQQVVQGRVDAH